MNTSTKPRLMAFVYRCGDNTTQSITVLV
ncbi:unnamed protein product, partial [Rotaria sp. Silwood2]